MPKNKIQDLRNLLFETIERLMDEDDPIMVQEAQTIANIGKVLVESAKVEVQFMKEVGGLGTGFIIDGNELDDRLSPKELESKS